MRALMYVSDGYPGLSETFTRREVQGLHADGVPLRVWSLHRPKASAPGLSPGDPPVTYLPSPASGEVLGAYLGWWRRRPGLVASLTAAVLTAPTEPFLAARVLRAPAHLLWGAWLAARLPPGAHVHAQFLGPACTVAWVASRLSGATFSFTAHAEWGFALLRPKLRDATFAIAISDWEKRRLLARAPGIPADRIVVNRLGTEPPPAPSRAAAPAGSAASVVAVGTLGEKKGHDVLIEAAARLRDRGVALRVDVVGEGPERPRLERLLRERALGGHVRLRGALPHEQALDLMAAADVVVLACRITPTGDLDGIPISLMEGMAMAKPVVSCRVSAIPELVEDGVTGLLVEPDRPADLAAAIGRLLGDGLLRRRLGSAAQETVRAHFDATASRRRLLAIFDAHLGTGDTASRPAAGGG